MAVDTDALVSFTFTKSTDGSSHCVSCIPMTHTHWEDMWVKQHFSPFFFSFPDSTSSPMIDTQLTLSLCHCDKSKQMNTCKQWVKVFTSWTVSICIHCMRRKQRRERGRKSELAASNRQIREETLFTHTSLGCATRVSDEQRQPISEEE